MSDLIIINCTPGSDAADVRCPVCKSVSRLLLEQPFTAGTASAKLKSVYFCPECRTEYTSCSVGRTDRAGEADAALSRKIMQWKRDLLDTGMRNRMINYRDTKRSSLKILEPEASELFWKLYSGKKLTFQKPITKETDIRTYALIALMETLSYTLGVNVGDIRTSGTVLERDITLKNLRAKAKLALEEQGTNILYLCFGFIYWRDPERKSAPVTVSPLLMMPVTLTQDSLNAPYKLSLYDDDISINPTLDYMFNTEYNIDLPAFEMKGRQSFDEYFNTLEELADKHGWKIVRDVGLGLFSFLKISMYHDLNGHRDMMVSHPVIRAMAGDRSAVCAVPPEAERGGLDNSDPGKHFEVVDADSSQEEALLLSRNGVSFVMQGPPGTGKSQTITNIIAEALADGKKIIFVSEKAAALQVVLKRLTEVGLDDFCLSLHDYKADKKDIINKIGANLSLCREYTDDSTARDLAELFDERTELNGYAGDLHRALQPLGISIYEAFGKYAKNYGTADIAFTIDDPAQISADRFIAMRRRVSAFESALRDIGCRLSENPWYETKATSASQAYRNLLIRDTDGLYSSLLRIAELAETAGKSLGSDKISTLSEIQALTGVLRTLSELPSPLRRLWFDHDIAARAKSFLPECRAHSDRLHKSTAAVLSEWDDAVLAYDPEQLRDRLGRDLPALLSSDPAADAVRSLGQTEAEADGLLSRAKALLESYRAALRLISADLPDTAENIRAVSDVLRLASGASYMDAAWFDRRKNAKAAAFAHEAQIHSEAVRSAEALVLHEWAPTVFGIDDAMIDRFGQFYNPDFMNAEDGYESDIRALSAYAKIEEATADPAFISGSLDLAEKITKSAAWFEENRKALYACLGDVYRGPETDRDGIAAAVSEAERFTAYKNIVAEAIKCARTASTLREELLRDWETSFFDIVAAPMLTRFKTEYTGVLHGLRQNYRRDMQMLRGCRKISAVVLTDADAAEALQKLKALNDSKEWIINNGETLKAALGYRFCGEWTNWDEVSRLAERNQSVLRAKRLIADAVNRIDELTADKNTLFAAWSSDLLSADIAAMRRRFGETYDRGFLSLHRQYTYDIKVLGTHLKDQSRALSGEAAAGAIGAVRAVRAGQSWFKENRSAAISLFGDGLYTEHADWARIEECLRTTAIITDCFPASSVPEETVSALLRICGDPRLAGEATNAAAPIEAKTVDALEADIRKPGFCPGYAGREGLSETVIPGIERCAAACRQGAEAISRLLAFKTNGFISGSDISELLTGLASARAERSWFDGMGGELTALYSDEYRGNTTDWDRLSACFEAVGRVRSHFADLDPERLIDAACETQEPEKLRSVASELLRLLDETGPKLDSFSAQFANTDFRIQNLKATAKRYNDCVNGFDRLDAWLHYTETKNGCAECGLEEFADGIAKLDNTVGDVCGAFERGFYGQWLESQLPASKRVGLFSRRTHEQRVKRFSELDTLQYTIARRRIREKIISTFPEGGVVDSTGQLALLRREMEKKRRIMPLRSLFRSIPDLLLTLKPCLMMSPLSVAYFLDAGAYKFDTVVFDEASQIFPQDAIGAIFRAKQVIIAGDTRQLPPTNFFAASTSNGEDEYGEDDDPNEPETYDSILEETSTVLPSRTLLWHYRSRHEHLIAFSNRKIYDGRLVTFPSSVESEPDTGVEFVYVEDGFYESAPKRNNIKEAKRIVELVKEHIEKHPERSLGVIAFSESQQQTIALEIQKFREKNSAYEAFFAEGREDEFFVKNLENVQGDERDTIIFSIGYAKTKEQKQNGKPMSMRFGPLNNAGGERRLNVAITRAKINVKLVSSILPSDIDPERTGSEGVLMLRSYIEFAMSGGAALPDVQKTAKDDEFADAVAKFIEKNGYKVKKYVGCSGYKIDIAVEYPSDTVHRYAAGIECDGFSYVSAHTARDRDRLRSSVLGKMGWNLYRVWSSAWYNNPDTEGRRLLEFIAASVESCRERIAELEEIERKAEEEKQRLAEEERVRTEREAEEREREKARMAAEREAEKERLAKERKKAEARVKAEHKAKNLRKEQPAKTADLSWVKPGAGVRHIRFGDGVIESIADSRLSVKFTDGEKVFIYPDVFTGSNGFLSRIPQSAGNESEQRTGSAPPSSDPADAEKAHLQIRSAFIHDLMQAGFIPIRSASSVILVRYEADKSDLFIKIAAAYDVRYMIETDGPLASQHGSVWLIMFNPNNNS